MDPLEISFLPSALLNLEETRKQNPRSQTWFQTLISLLVKTHWDHEHDHDNGLKRNKHSNNPQTLGHH